MKKITGLLLLSLMLAPLPAWSWGREGHAIVGDIAEQHLSPAALGVVRELLREDRTAYGKPSHAQHLADIAFWPDELRGTDTGKQFSHWHFRDNPVCGIASGDCPGGDCVDVKINGMIATLRSRSASVREKNEALKWLVHLVGDIHQPLHVGENHDHGGNTIRASLAGSGRQRHESLHAMWDKTFVTLAMQQGNIGDHLPTVFEQGTPAQWMQDSRALAASVAYGKLPGFTCGGTSPEDVELDLAYQQAAEETVRQQLQLAGLRLAGVLNALYH